MFKDDWLQHQDVPAELVEQVSILIDGRLAVLADCTISATPGSEVTRS
jgi:hypothetical protein